ncbi:MAG TPA: two-component regulator propeller domain-containing protein, partial [Cytophagales bacterium]
MVRFCSHLAWWVAALAGFTRLAPAQSRAGNPLPGLPLITHYSPTAYRAHEQVWASVQGPDGRFYFANGDGLLVYDNSGWELIRLTNKNHVRSLGFSADSTLYIGGDGEIGCLQTDDYGRLRYVSLVPRLPASERGFSRVWTTAQIGGKMYFQTHERLFVFDGQRFSVYPTGGLLQRTFPVEGTFYGRMMDRGLVRWTGDGFEPVPGGAYFADKPIATLLPYGPEGFLIGTEAGELVIYDGRNLRPFRTEAAGPLAEHGLEDGCWLGGDRLALALRTGGLYVLDRAGKPLQALNDTHGLGSNRVLSCYPDRQGNLWLGTQSGITKVALGEPLRQLDRRLGLHGS